MLAFMIFTFHLLSGAPVQIPVYLGPAAPPPSCTTYDSYPREPSARAQATAIYGPLVAQWEFECVSMTFDPSGGLR